MAHSDIFLCGPSNESALLLERKRESLSAFSLSNFQKNILVSLGRPYTLIQDLPKQGISLCNRPSSVGNFFFIKLKPRMNSN